MEAVRGLSLLLELTEMLSKDLRLHLRSNNVCALLGYYAAYSGNSLPTFRDNLSATFSRVKKLSRNVGKELPVHAA